MATVERPTNMASLPSGIVEYRLERQREATVLVFHGGHMRAGLALGEEIFSELGYTLLVPSRPGYGATPLSTGTTPQGFADVSQELCEHLAIERLSAVAGISGGGPTAVNMAGRHPDLVDALILESAVGFLRWPDRHVYLGGRVLFNSWTQRITWGGVRTLLRLVPQEGLRLLLGSLSLDSGGQVLAALSEEDRATLRALFSRMSSGRGFSNDLRITTQVQPDAQEVTSHVTQPTLVIGSRLDGQVPFAHAESLAASLPGAELVTSDAETHLLWFGSDYPVISDRITEFLGEA
ncbi:MAG: alpha/beta fold hydrolase [Acidimicrobiia bacterium]|nr:alpha/beta fold hydrolase [Acidimicrobiia bacterium]